MMIKRSRPGVRVLCDIYTNIHIVRAYGKIASGQRPWSLTAAHTEST